MSVRVVDRVDGWDQRPFDGGYGGLHDLADEEFSGVVRAGGAEAYLTMGTVVAVRHGTIEDFEAASGTVHVAPAPALPLLAVMQEADVDVRAQYYSEETPISEVDGTLSSGGFTGYVELSENVLSGDYYVVYYGGRSLSVAFVGERGELITDEAAFDRADDEVGIFEVVSSEIAVKEVPEPDGGPAAAASAGGEDGEESPEETDSAAMDAASAGAAAGAVDAAAETASGDDTAAETAGSGAPADREQADDEGRGTEPTEDEPSARVDDEPADADGPAETAGDDAGGGQSADVDGPAETVGDDAGSGPPAGGDDRTPGAVDESPPAEGTPADQPERPADRRPRPSSDAGTDERRPQSGGDGVDDVLTLPRRRSAAAVTLF